MIKNNADVNVMDLEHNTPLHVVREDYYSLVNESIECAVLLIRAGTDLNASNIHGKTPMANYLVKYLKENKPELFK